MIREHTGSASHQSSRSRVVSANVDRRCSITAFGLRVQQIPDMANLFSGARLEANGQRRRHCAFAVARRYSKACQRKSRDRKLYVRIACPAETHCGNLER